MASKHNNNIRVMCRFRPINEIEQSKNGTIIYKLLKKNGTMIEHPDKVHHPQPMSFFFDRIFDSKTAQVELFEEAALPLIDNIFEGYNATIFAYGQTGSGKTHTMMGDMIKSEMHPRHGIIPRVVREIWNRIVHASSNYEFELKVSFLEIYNEQIYDLLSEDGYQQRKNKKRKKNKRQKLIIREYSDQVFVENLNEIYVRDQNELFDLIKSANKHRKSAETKMNNNSSRSHAVLTIILGQEDIRTGNSKKSKFCLVDLAGSEKVGKTQAKGIRLKEATSINKSLTTLGTCMNKLADNMKVNNSNNSLRHIPFRESVLTRLLSDSLGGNCKTTLIVNTSPCSYNVEETISTLRFGERAKKIKTKARINQIKTPQQYRKELQIAQTEILKLYRIIEECAEDITNAFKGTLSVDNCKSYRNLLDLKKSTLNILNGTKPSKKNNNNSLLAHILPDLTHLQALKKVNTVKKQQKKQIANNNNNASNLPPLPPPPQQQQILHRQLSSGSNNSSDKPMTLRRQTMQMGRQTSNPNAKQSPKTKAFDPRDRLRRTRNGSFEELNVDEPVKLVRGKKPKNDPLKPKNRKQDFRVKTNSVNPAFIPPDFHKNIFEVSGNIMIPDMKADDGLTLAQMGGNFIYNSNVEDSEISDYNSEFDAMCLISPAVDTQSDASNISSYNQYFTYSDVEIGNQSMDFTDFQEEELPKHFFEYSREQRIEFAKQKRVDPLLIEYRYQISREIDWMDWDSGDEEESDTEIKNKQRMELERDIDFHKQRLLMLCRLIRTKTQESSSRIDIEISKYQSLSAKYRAKNEENSKLMQQNTRLEKLYEHTENDKREMKKNLKMLQRELTEKKKQANKLQKQLTRRMNELNIERQNQINLSNDKTSMLRQKVHEKYGNKYMRKIEHEIIKNNHKDIRLRFNELAKAFNQQSNKYCDLEEIIEKSKKQIQKYKELMRQKDHEENALREEIENEDLMQKELILQHNLEIKKIQNEIKSSKKKADMWKRRAFVYKNTVNSLMEEQEFNNMNEDESDSDEKQSDRESDDENPPSFNPRQGNFRQSFGAMTNAKLKPLESFSPRSMARSIAEEEGKDEGNNNMMIAKSKSSTWAKHRKSRQSIGCSDDLMSKSKSSKIIITKPVNRGRKNKFPKSKYNRNLRAISPIRNDPFHMSASQKAALTSVKMKIRGGGGSDRDVYNTPHITTDTLPSKKIYNKGSFNANKGYKNKNNRIHKRRESQPLNGSLPPPSNRHAGYSSDEYQMTYSNDKSRSPVPIVVGLDSLMRNKSIEMDNIDQSPASAYMGPYKRGTSPLPPPPRAQTLYQPGGVKFRNSTEADAEDSDEDFEDEFENNTDIFLSPNNRDQFTSPAGSFFSKIKQVSVDHDFHETEYKSQTNIKKNNRKPQAQPRPRKRAVPMPEPTGCSDDDEFGGYSDYSNYTDDNVPSYNKYNNNNNDTLVTYQLNKLPSLSRNDSREKRGSKRNLLTNKKKGKRSERSVADICMD